MHKLPSVIVLKWVNLFSFFFSYFWERFGHPWLRTLGVNTNESRLRESQITIPTTFYHTIQTRLTPPYKTFLGRSYSEFPLFKSRLSKRSYSTLRWYYQNRNEYKLSWPWTRFRNASLGHTTNQPSHCSRFPISRLRMVHRTFPKHSTNRSKLIQNL